MSTIVVHAESEAQEKAVIAVLEAMQISFEQELDETEYLSSSPEMIARIAQSEKDLAEGKGVKIDLKDLWK